MRRVERKRRHFLNASMLVASLAAIPWSGERIAIAAEQPRPAIVVLGDSISAEYGLERGTGWVSLLQARLPDWQVVNASISGETTAGGRARIARVLATHEPQVLVIELGGNDALRGLDLNSSARNLNGIASLARQQGAQVVVLGMQVPPNYGRAYTERFAAIFTEVADKHEAELVPFLLEDIVGLDDAFQSDRIHPSAKVQPVLLDTAWPAIKRAINKR